MSAGSSLPAAVSSHFFLLVSNLFSLRLVSYFSLSVCESDTGCLQSFAYLPLSDSLPCSLTVISTVSDRSDDYSARVPTPPL